MASIAPATIACPEIGCSASTVMRQPPITIAPTASRNTIVSRSDAAGRGASDSSSDRCTPRGCATDEITLASPKCISISQEIDGALRTTAMPHAVVVVYGELRLGTKSPEARESVDVRPVADDDGRRPRIDKTRATCVVPQPVGVNTV